MLQKIFLFLLLITLTVSAQTNLSVGLSQGQTIYVPAYSHIYAGNREMPVLLTVTLSIRNTDAKGAITITKVVYYGTHGEILKSYLVEPLTLAPFGSTRFVIPQKDKSGGSGANFVVEWKSIDLVNPPIVESIMIGAEGQLGISFTSRGQVITADKKP